MGPSNWRWDRPGAPEQRPEGSDRPERIDPFDISGMPPEEADEFYRWFVEVTASGQEEARVLEVLHRTGELPRFDEQPAHIWHPYRQLEPGLTVRDVLGAHVGELDRAKLVANGRYIADHPQLHVARGLDPLVQALYVERDRSGAHDHVRHDGLRGDQGQVERALHLRDPAHPADTPDYLHATDALTGRQHHCGFNTSHIPDPVAYAATVARLHQHPRIKPLIDKLITTPEPSYVPVDDIPIAEILGPDGHLAARGYQLVRDPDTSQKEAKDSRKEWVTAVRAELADGAPDHAAATERVSTRAIHDSSLVEPRIEPIPTFEGGTFTVVMAPKADRSGYYMHTMHPDPPESSDQADQQSQNGTTEKP